MIRFARKLICTRFVWSVRRSRVIVAPQRPLARRRATGCNGGETVRIDPDPHGDLPSALVVTRCTPVRVAKLRLERPQQPIRQGRHRASGDVKTQIKRGIRAIGPLHLHRRGSRLRRQLRSEPVATAPSLRPALPLLWFNFRCTVTVLTPARLVDSR